MKQRLAFSATGGTSGEVPSLTGEGRWGSRQADGLHVLMHSLGALNKYVTDISVTMLIYIGFAIRTRYMHRFQGIMHEPRNLPCVGPAWMKTNVSRILDDKQQSSAGVAEHANSWNKVVTLCLYVLLLLVPPVDDPYGSHKINVLMLNPSGGYSYFFWSSGNVMSKALRCCVQVLLIGFVSWISRKCI